MHISAKIALGSIILLIFPFLVEAQIPDPVTFTVTDAPQEIRAGEAFDLTLRADIEGEWHLYSVNIGADAGPFPTRFTPANALIALTDSVRESAPVVEYDPNFKTELGWHSGEATFTIPIAFVKKVNGSTEAVLEVNYQVCTDRVCLPPETKNITHALAVSGVADAPVEAYSGQAPALAQSNDDGAKSSTGYFESNLGGNGIFSFLWLALAAGFAALLTPCVFPMIPLTVAFFSKQNGANKASTVGSALGFGLAIVVTFTILGALLAVFIGASGANQFAANPWVNLIIAAVLVVFALSLLGAFEIRLPHQFTNWLNQKSKESSGLLGVLFMALTISAVSFSCTAPFVGGVLAATTGGAWFYPIIGMIGFSAAFASPFVVLATFPRWVESLPQSGSWMNVAKVLLGFIELAAAFKFLSNADLVWEWGLVSRPLTIAAWIAIFLLAGLYVLGVYTMRHEEKPKRIGTGRLLLSVPFLMFSFYLIPGLLGASLGIWDAWLPPKQATDVSVVYSISQRGGGGESSEFENWSDNYQASVNRAAQNNQPVFIDFTGYTCTNCRAMEAQVFPTTPVQQKFDQMELVRLYTDDGTDGPANQKFQFQFTGTVALPTYVIVDPHSKQIIAQLRGYTGKKEFNEFLNRGLETFNKKKKAI